jgi:hypothetical protein
LVRLGLPADVLQVHHLPYVAMHEDVVTSADPDQFEPEIAQQAAGVVESDIPEVASSEPQ